MPHDAIGRTNRLKPTMPAQPRTYRFVLHHPAVTVALMAPQTRAELDEDLTVLEAQWPMSDDEYRILADHGQRVRRHAGQFP
jgi:predicted aldo/keto reductase-like oxidoreductase